MAAFHHLNDQLFMPRSLLMSLDVDNELTHEDVEEAQGHVRDPYTQEFRVKEPKDAFWERKEDEAITSGVYQSISRHGVVNPVELRKTGRSLEILNGYHRIAASPEHSFVPVTYSGRPEVEGLPVHYNRVNENPIHPRENSWSNGEDD